MFDESAYIETIRTESGVVVGVAYDESAANDCPIDWVEGHAAALVIDAEDDAVRRDLERLGSAEDAALLARYHAAEDEDEAEREAFTKHYTRKGWTVQTCTMRGDMGEYPITAVIAVDNSYGTPDMLAKELEDWAFGRVYRLDFYAPYRYGDTVELQLYESIGGVYMTDWSDDEAVREDIESYAADYPAPATLTALFRVSAAADLAA